jgi:hypothetical protein
VSNMPKKYHRYRHGGIAMIKPRSPRLLKEAVVRKDQRERMRDARINDIPGLQAGGPVPSISDLFRKQLQSRRGSKATRSRMEPPPVRSLLDRKPDADHSRQLSDWKIRRALGEPPRKSGHNAQDLLDRREREMQRKRDLIEALRRRRSEESRISGLAEKMKRALTGPPGFQEGGPVTPEQERGYFPKLWGNKAPNLDAPIERMASGIMGGVRSLKDLFSRDGEPRKVTRRDLLDRKEREMQRAATMRRNRDRLAEVGQYAEDIPDWLAENTELVDSYLQNVIGNETNDPLPPIVTRENVGMMSEEEKRKWGGGMASGGIIGLQTGGPAPMGQYSGYGGPGQFQVRQETLHPGVAQQYGQLTGAIMQAGARPLQQFGPGVAGMTQMEAAAQAGIGAYGRGQGPQGTIQGMSTLGQAAQGVGSMIPQQQALASQYGALAPQALQQAQAGAQGMQNLAGRAELQGQLAGAGMRQTGAAAQAEQQALGAETERRGRIAQGQMQQLGLGQAQAGQAALGAQQDYAAGLTGMGATAAAQGLQGQQAMQDLAAQSAATGRQGLGMAQDTASQLQSIGAGAGAIGQQQAAALGDTGRNLFGLGQQALSQMGATGQAARKAGQVGAEDIRAAGLEGKVDAASAAKRMRDIGGQAPQLQKGADLSDYMSQYTKGVTDPQLRQLQEFQKQQAQELGSQAAGAGAFGGYRQGIMQGQQQQQASQQAADIIGKGQQEAFQQAQQAFQADRAAQQQAQQTGLSAEQQAAQTEAGVRGERQASAQAATQAQQSSIRDQLAAQQAGFGQAGQMTAQQLQAQQAAGSQQLQAQGMQGQLAGQAGQAGQQGVSQLLQAQGQQGQQLGQGQQAAMQALQAQMGAQGQAAGMADVGAARQMQGLQAQQAATAQGIGMSQQALDAQRAAATQGAQLGMQGQQQGFGMAQQGTATGLAGLQAAQQAGQQGFGTAADLMRGQAGAMGAQAGAYGQLAGIGGQQLTGGQQQQNQFMARQRMMEQAGMRQRQLAQSGLDYQRAQFDQRQQYPQQQIGWMNQQLGALPYQSTVTQGQYTPQAGPISNLMSAGVGAQGLWNAYRGGPQATG